MLSVNYAECHKYAHYAECHYTECHYAECRGASLVASLAVAFSASLSIAQTIVCKKP